MVVRDGVSTVVGLHNIDLGRGAGLGEAAGAMVTRYRDMWVRVNYASYGNLGRRLVRQFIPPHPPPIQAVLTDSLVRILWKVCDPGV